MATKTPKKRSWIGLTIKLFCLIGLAIAITAPLFTAVNFFRQADKFILYLEIGDPEGAKRELDKLHYFYALSKKWKVQWLADKFLFNDAYFYQVGHIYLTENWDGVIEALKNKLDDSRSYPYANAKFWQAQQMYKAGKKDEALTWMLGEIHQDYERDLRNCLNLSSHLECFDRVYNYDRTSTKKDAEEALKKGKVLPEYILGPLRGEDELPRPPEPGKMPSGGKSLDEEKSRPGDDGGGGQERRP